ncbi:hypothetical protein DXA60_15860 [Roseburia sp. OF03-24]|uniref:hypothetical protein n=1 Tax=Roseburia TaxID=841 RepID=UPI000E4DB3CD|nr:hypothetical protein DXA60_15860 [Roseburia sp. OF03-24]RHF91481.1 hypothetical protein DW650_17070 [Roseburia sp. AM23-20]
MHRQLLFPTCAGSAWIIKVDTTWYRDKKCTKKVTSIKKGSTGKMTLYAKWKKK